MDINGLSGLPATSSSLAPGVVERLKKGPKEEFLAYMEKSPAERMRDAWLGNRGLTEEDLKAMSPQEREAIEKQMAEDIKKQMEEEARAKAVLANKPPLSLAAVLAITF